MSKPSAEEDRLFGLVADERNATATMLEGLTDDQWASASLCDDWTVRDVAGHLTVGWNTGWTAFMIGLLKHRGFDKFNKQLAQELAGRPTSEIVADLRQNAQHRFTPPGSGALAPLSDVVIHTADIRYPLGLPSLTPLTTTTIVLDRLANPPKRLPLALKNTDGLAFHATDGEWSAGSGATVEGTVDALLLSMAGRPVLGDLTGPGLPLLRQRLEA